MRRKVNHLTPPQPNLQTNRHKSKNPNLDPQNQMKFQHLICQMIKLHSKEGKNKENYLQKEEKLLPLAKRECRIKRKN